MLYTLIFFLLFLYVLLKDSNDNDDTDDNDLEKENRKESNYFKKAEEETRKELKGINSRYELNRFLMWNGFDPKDYEDMSIDRVKEKIIFKSRERGRIYRRY